MHVYHDLSEVSKDKKTVLTLGTFDGLHLGHKEIIEEVKSKASLIGGRSFLVTFYPHPRNVVSKNRIKLLSTLREKVAMLESLGIENLLVINFTKEFSQLSSDDFFEKYIIEGIGISEIVIGHDHHFGKGRSGNEATLREMGYEFGFEVTPVDAINVNGEIVSSTKVRNALNEGNVKKAGLFLGRNYAFTGTVIEGDKRGRELGFPTANLKIDSEDKLLPAIGIYAVNVKVDSKNYNGLLSIGKRPTFYDSGNVTSEVYIYDFNADIYGKEITLSLIDRIRGEERYSSADELIAQMNKDKEAGLKILNAQNN